MKILVTGASGMIGGRLAEHLVEAGHDVVGTHHRRAPREPAHPVRALDLLEGGAVEALLDEERPDVVVHTAALANPAECERDPELAAALNVDAVEALARAVRERGRRLVHFSTDLVFDGGRGPFRESHAPAPRSVYARTKLAGEAMALEAGEAIVLRCALVYGRSRTGDRTFNEWIWKRVRAGEPVTLFHDEYRTPIDDRTLGRLVAGCLDADLRGVRHCGGGERLSRFAFGRILAEVAGWDGDTLRSGSRLDADLVPDRPEDVSLISSRLAEELGVELLDVRPALQQWWNDLEGESGERADSVGG